MVRHINTTRREYTAFVVLVVLVVEGCIFRDVPASFPGKTLSHSFSETHEHHRRLRLFHEEGGSLLLVVVVVGRGRLLPTEGCRRYPAEHIVALFSLRAILFRLVTIPAACA